jgi:tRNA(Ile)-lysidine synthase
MSPLARRVLRRLRADALVGNGDRVAVAISGGADSVALTWLLREIEQAGRLRGTIAGLIHVNHQLRGAESDRDETFCRTLAERLSWPIEVGAFDVAARARAARRSIEATARDVRYEFFDAAARRLGSTRVATAHTLDDQAETALLRLLRGAGFRGAGGIRVRRGIFIRPSLDCRRAELRAYLIDQDEAFCDDSSNRDLSVPRNRVRHQLLPVIEEIAPGGIAALARFAGLAADDESYLEHAAAEAAAGLVASVDRNAPNGVQLNVAALRRLPAPLSRRVLRQAFDTVRPGGALSAVHLEAALRLASSVRPSGELDLPGLKVARRGPTLCIDSVHGPRRTARRAEATADGVSRFEAVLDVPGRVEIPEAGVSVTATTHAPGVAGAVQGHPGTVVIQASSVALPLVVRNRRPGDRLRPFGAPGRRKLQDLFVDRKVPRQDRDLVPLVVDAAGRIVWVVGLTIADECRVTAPATGVVVLKAERKDST